MTAYLSPGVYTRETNFSFYVKQISTSACGMIGIAEKGPISKPVLVTSWEQFTRKFGSYITYGYLAYAARAFFDNGGQMLYVVPRLGLTVVMTSDNRASAARSGHRSDLHQLMGRIIEANAVRSTTGKRSRSR